MRSGNAGRDAGAGRGVATVQRGIGGGGPERGRSRAGLRRGGAQGGAGRQERGDGPGGLTPTQVI